MSRTASSGQQGIQPGSHYAPNYDTRRDSSFNLPSALPLGATRLHGVRARKDHASFPASGAPFERSQFTQAMLDVGALLFGSLYVLLWVVVILGLSPFAFFCLFLVSFH